MLSTSHPFPMEFSINATWHYSLCHSRAAYEEENVKVAWKHRWSTSTLTNQYTYNSSFITGLCTVASYCVSSHTDWLSPLNSDLLSGARHSLQQNVEMMLPIHPVHCVWPQFLLTKTWNGSQHQIKLKIKWITIKGCRMTRYLLSHDAG